MARTQAAAEGAGPVAPTFGGPDRWPQRGEPQHYDDEHECGRDDGHIPNLTKNAENVVTGDAVDEVGSRAGMVPGRLRALCFCESRNVHTLVKPSSEGGGGKE